MRSCCQRWFSEACGTSSACGVPRRAAASNRSLRTGTTCKLLRPSSAETGDTHRVYIYRHLKYARVACEFWLRLLEATRCCGADRHSRAAASAVLSRRGWKLRRRSQSLADALRVRWIRVGACSHLHDVTRHNRGHTLGVPTTSHTKPNSAAARRRGPRTPSRSSRAGDSLASRRIPIVVTAYLATSSTVVPRRKPSRA